MCGRTDVGLRYLCLPDSGGCRNNPEAFPAKTDFTSGSNMNLGNQPKGSLIPRSSAARCTGPTIPFRRRPDRSYTVLTSAWLGQRSPQALCHAPIGSPGHPVYHAGASITAISFGPGGGLCPRSFVHEEYSNCPNSAWELHSAHESPQVAT